LKPFGLNLSLTTALTLRFYVHGCVIISEIKAFGCIGLIVNLPVNNKSQFHSIAFYATCRCHVIMCFATSRGRVPFPELSELQNENSVQIIDSLGLIAVEFPQHLYIARTRVFGLYLRWKTENRMNGMIVCWTWKYATTTTWRTEEQTRQYLLPCFDSWRAV